jgi:indole-3-glycerol phosphate synthase
MTTLPDALARICARTREDVAARKAARPEAVLRRAAEAAPAPRGFLAALRRAAAAGRMGLIAEIKRASPSAGLIRADFDPPALARAYRDGGADCLSVLTEAPFFQGAPAHLVAARAAVDLPVLRKDFMLDPWMVLEARTMGADCILLIMACLTDAEAAALEAAAEALGMDVLVEVHDAAELDRANRLRTPLLGINNRNLKTLKTDLATTERLAARLGAERFAVAESGIRTPADVARMKAAGVRALLVGESLMRQPDVTHAAKALLA